MPDERVNLLASVLRPVDCHRVRLGLQHDAALEVRRVRELVEGGDPGDVVCRAQLGHVACERLGVARHIHDPLKARREAAACRVESSARRVDEERLQPVAARVAEVYPRLLEPPEI